MQEDKTKKPWQENKSKKLLPIILIASASLILVAVAVLLFVYLSPVRLIRLVSSGEIVNSGASSNNDVEYTDGADSEDLSINSLASYSAFYKYDDIHSDYNVIYGHDCPIIESEILIDFSIPKTVDWSIPIDLIPEYDYYSSTNIGDFYWVMRDTYDRYANEYSLQQWSVRSEFPDEDRIVIRSYKKDVILEVEYIHGEINYYSYIILSSTSDFAVEAFYDSEGILRHYNVNNYTYFDWGRCERIKSYNADGELQYSVIYHSDPNYNMLECFD